MVAPWTFDSREEKTVLQLKVFHPTEMKIEGGSIVKGDWFSQKWLTSIALFLRGKKEISWMFNYFMQVVFYLTILSFSQKSL